MKATTENIKRFGALIGKHIWVHISDGVHYHTDTRELLLQEVVIVHNKLRPKGINRDRDATRCYIDGGWIDCIKDPDTNEVLYMDEVWDPPYSKTIGYGVKELSAALEYMAEIYIQYVKNAHSEVGVGEQPTQRDIDRVVAGVLDNVDVKVKL